MKDDYQEVAWSVYLGHQDVFAGVLKATGPWQINDGMDLVHDFLVERLPQALRSYDVQRGPIRPWLYTVFTRYAKRRLSEKAALGRRLLALDSIGETLLAQPNKEETFTAEEERCVRDALQQLPDHLRTALLSYFGDGPEAGNIRALTRKFEWSRHRAYQTVIEALATLAAQLDEQGILTNEELEICRARLVDGATWKEIATRLGKTQHQVRMVLDSALRKLGAPFAKTELRRGILQ